MSRRQTVSMSSVADHNSCLTENLTNKITSGNLTFTSCQMNEYINPTSSQKGDELTLGLVFYVQYYFILDFTFSYMLQETTCPVKSKSSFEYIFNNDLKAYSRYKFHNLIS